LEEEYPYAIILTSHCEQCRRNEEEVKEGGMKKEDKEKGNQAKKEGVRL
jgi:hypothetical protein